MEKINIAEILKDCPKGMELYSPLCGKCVFDRLNMGTIICKKQNTQEITFTREGYYMLPVFDDCECMIFPSKDQRDWSKFHRSFKDGDVLVHTQNQRFVMSIYHSKGTYHSKSTGLIIKTHCILWDKNEGLSVNMEICCYDDEVRLATEEEKQKLFDAIKENGYKWNEETKTLEKLIPKFDITTLKPFDRVLVRDTDTRGWTASLFSHYSKNGAYKYICTNNNRYAQCIPYEGNEHLLGKMYDCDEFYKTWE